MAVAQNNMSNYLFRMDESHWLIGPIHTAPTYTLVVVWWYMVVISNVYIENMTMTNLTKTY